MTPLTESWKGEDTVASSILSIEQQVFEVELLYFVVVVLA